MENIDKSPATPESVWATFREADRQRKEAEAKFDRELASSRADFERQMAEYRAEAEKRNAEAEKIRLASNADYERRMKNLEKRYGSQSDNLGAFAEEYFFNSFEDGKKNFFGEEFDDIERNVKGLKQIVKDEYDNVMLNGTSVAIIETKFKAHVNDLPKVIKKAETLRINYPDFANHRIYLGLASMSFYDELEDECKKAGIAIVKQIGEKVVIADEHLKVF